MVLPPLKRYRRRRVVRGSKSRSYRFPSLGPDWQLTRSGTLPPWHVAARLAHRQPQNAKVKRPNQAVGSSASFSHRIYPPHSIQPSLTHPAFPARRTTLGPPPDATHRAVAVVAPAPSAPPRSHPTRYSALLLLACFYFFPGRAFCRLCPGFCALRFPPLMLNAKLHGPFPLCLHHPGWERGRSLVRWSTW